jgi:hypothetical protein
MRTRTQRRRPEHSIDRSCHLHHPHRGSSQRERDTDNRHEHGHRAERVSLEIDVYPRKRQSSCGRVAIVRRR